MVPADADAAAKPPPDVEKPDYSSQNGAPNSAAAAAAGGGGGGVVDSVVARWRREDMLDKSPLALHAAAAAFAFVALVLVASNQHGDWMEFDRYQEYRFGTLPPPPPPWPSSIQVDGGILGCVVAVFDARYLLAIAALAFAYSLAQALRHALRMRRGVDPVPTASGRLLDFASDQVSCYCVLIVSPKYFSSID